MNKTIQKLLNTNPWLVFTFLVAVQVGYFLSQYDSWSQLTEPSAVGGLLIAISSIFVQSVSRSVIDGGN